MTQSLGEMLPILAELSARRDERRSLAELAALAGRSPSQFQRAFSRVVGESPKQFNRRLQLECAAAALLIGERSVLDIALDCGFESHEGFTRAFTRHFGRSPCAFRAAASGQDPGDLRRHAELLRHVGPCIGLYGVSVNPPRDSAQAAPMSYDITIQDIPETTFLFKEGRCDHSGVSDLLAQLLPACFGYAMKSGIQMVSPPMTLYTDWGPGHVALQAGLCVVPGSEGEGDIQTVVLPATKAAVTVHTGPYDELGKAHAAIESYIESQGLEASGPAREVYLTDPGEVPDPKDWKTQVIRPV